MAHLAEPGPRVAHGQTQVFARKGVGQVDSLIEVGRFDNPAARGQRLFDDRAAGERLELLANLGIDCVRNADVRRDEE